MVGRDRLGSMSTVSKAAEDNLAALSDVSSAYPAARSPADDDDLELGLSLGAKKPTAGLGRNGNPGVRRDRCRILTAEDFSSPTSPLSSSASSSISPPRSAAKPSPNQPSPAVVGWPPIRSFRINNLASQSKHSDVQKKTEHQERRSRSLFVKANMDGDPIGRKVDLAAHLSYHSLALALEDMFMKPVSAGGSTLYGAKASRLLDGASEFVLTYEDKEGDWMLVGDVPWGMFLKTVKRLRIMRAAEANAPRCQSS